MGVLLSLCLAGTVGSADAVELNRLDGFMEVGATLDRQSRPRVAGGVEWLPFQPTDWGGLGEVFGSATLQVAARGRGDASLGVWVGYGRPRARAWMSFAGGLATVVGWGTRQGTEFLPYSPMAAIRLGWGTMSLRIAGYVTSQNTAVRGDYYSAMLGVRWPVYDALEAP